MKISKGPSSSSSLPQAWRGASPDLQLWIRFSGRKHKQLEISMRSVMKNEPGIENHDVLPAVWAWAWAWASCRGSLIPCPASDCLHTHSTRWSSWSLPQPAHPQFRHLNTKFLIKKPPKFHVTKPFDDPWSTWSTWSPGTRHISQLPDDHHSAPIFWHLPRSLARGCQ